MTSVGDALKKMRRAHGRLTLAQVEEISEARGHKVTASNLSKVERGVRSLSDDVFERLVATFDLDETERAEIEAARSGTATVDVTEAVARLETQITLLRGEVSASANLIMATIERLRQSLPP
jgi:hypothetical protein